jgi:Zn-dependent protease with chaperone function
MRTRSPVGRKTAVTALLTAALALGAAREIKPGFNLFSKEQDVQLGKEAAQQIEKEAPVVRNQPELERYISDMGHRLAKVSQAPEYPYTFKIVASKGINAFALPGGPIYMHAATIAAADNEAQLAGVMAHEIAHVALRHGTNQVSKAYAWQIPLALAGGALGGGGSLVGQLAQLGVGLGVNSVLLKYSRAAARDADIVGARMMAQAGYDPVEMARFFQKLEGEGGGRGLEFLASHPNPGNRVRGVQEELRNLPPRQYRTSSAEFPRMKALAAKIPVGETRPVPGAAGAAGNPRIGPPSREFREFRGAGFRLAHPANWRSHGSDSGMGVTIAPEQGVVQDRRGQSHVALGAMAGYFSPRTSNLRSATDELVSDISRNNPGLQPLRGQRQRLTVDGSNGELLRLAGNSPFANQRELDTLLTVTRPEGLFFLILVAPESEYQGLQTAFQQILQSVRFR